MWVSTLTGFCTKHHYPLAQFFFPPDWRHMPVIPTLGTWWQENWEFKASFHYMASWKPIWDIWGFASKKIFFSSHQKAAPYLHLSPPIPLPFPGDKSRSYAYLDTSYILHSLFCLVSQHDAIKGRPLLTEISFIRTSFLFVTAWSNYVDIPHFLYICIKG